MPSWAKPMLVVRNEQVLSSEEAGAMREGDHLYLLAPPEKAQALDRFFVDMPPPAAPDPRLLGDFFVPGNATLGALAEIYGLESRAEEATLSLTDYFAAEDRASAPHRAICCRSDRSRSSPIRSTRRRVTNVGLRLAEPTMMHRNLGRAGVGRCG